MAVTLLKVAAVILSPESSCIITTESANIYPGVGGEALQPGGKHEGNCEKETYGRWASPWGTEGEKGQKGEGSVMPRPGQQPSASPLPAIPTGSRLKP